MQILAEILTNFDPSLKKLHSQIEKVPTYLHNLEVMRGQKIQEYSHFIYFKISWLLLALTFFIPVPFCRTFKIMKFQFTKWIILILVSNYFKLYNFL